jgi:transketolase
MALAPAAYVLWTRHLRHDPAAPDWPDRDRFVLSCGHASMLVYAMLYLSGYDLTLDDIRAFRQWGSRTPGHPEHGHTAGVETTTGPRQGLIRSAWRYYGCSRPSSGDLVNHRTGTRHTDLMDGRERSRLSRVTRWSSQRSRQQSHHDDGAPRLLLGGRRQALKRTAGTCSMKDGNDLEAVDQALTAAQRDEPSSIIVLTTIIGTLPYQRDTAEAHGAPLGKAEVAATKATLAGLTRLLRSARSAGAYESGCRATGDGPRGMENPTPDG